MSLPADWCCSLHSPTCCPKCDPCCESCPNKTPCKDCQPANVGQLERVTESKNKTYTLETPRWIVEITESDKSDGSMLEIRSRRGEFVLTDMGSGTAYYPAVKLSIALRSK